MTRTWAAMAALGVVLSMGCGGGGSTAPTTPTPVTNLRLQLEVDPMAAPDHVGQPGNHIVGEEHIKAETRDANWWLEVTCHVYNDGAIDTRLSTTTMTVRDENGNIVTFLDSGPFSDPMTMNLDGSLATVPAHGELRIGFGALKMRVAPASLRVQLFNVGGGEVANQLFPVEIRVLEIP